MLENHFFPTPVEVIEQMLEPYIYWKTWEKDDGTVEKYANGLRHSIKHSKRDIHNILDPSAGAGAILDYICDKLRYRRDIFAIEIDPDLRYTLTGKGYKCIGTDFLEHDEPVTFDLILANPPFKDGAKHALKIWSLLAPGGDATILLNAETVLNPFTNERQALIGLISLHGEVTNLGQAFKNAERPTNVEVAMVRLHKPTEQNQFHFEGNFETEVEEVEEFTQNPLAHRNVIKDLVQRYQVAVDILKERDRAQQRLELILSPISSDYYGGGDKLNLGYETPSFQKQLRSLKGRFWATVFDWTKLSGRCTSDFQQKFQTFAQSQKDMAFTEQNIYEVLTMFFGNIEQIMNDQIVTVFDELCAYHKKNKVHHEGWKTNKGWRLNKKIIHPYGIVYEPKWNSFRTSWSRDDVYTDLDKILCYITGRKYEHIISIQWAIDNFISNYNHNRHHGSSLDHQQVFSSTFFDIRVYKKGTVHLLFNDEEICDQLNIRVAKIRNWIGDGS